MALVNFTQTVTAGVAAAAFCSGLTANAENGTKQATNGGTPSSTEVSLSVSGSATNLRFFYFELPVDVAVTWAAGNWTVRINVTTGAANSTWESCYICRVNSSNVSQATIGSGTSLAIAINATGVQSTVVSGAAQTPGVGDKVIVVLGLTNTNSCTRTLGITPDQNIDSPFTVVDVDAPSFAQVGAY